ncbi:MAG: hypothetical protein WCP21_21240, partial [Armatimonadota bacterium]
MEAGAPGTIGVAMFRGAALIFSLVIAAYPFYRVVSMWFDKALESHEAFLYLGALLMLLLGIITAWGTPLGWLLLAALLVCCLGLPLLSRIADRATLRRLEDDDIRKFTASLERQPQNTYSRERLARIFLGRRQYEVALAQMKAALDVAPTDTNLTRLRERIETERRRAVERLKVCPKCAAENHQESGGCAQCGFLFVDPADLLRMLWTKPALQ